MFSHKRKSAIEKKNVRLEKKKRKWQAFIDICTTNESNDLEQNLTTEESECETTSSEVMKRQKTHGGGTDPVAYSAQTINEMLERELSEMKKKIKQRHKEKMLKPVFALNATGENATFNKENLGVSPLAVSDIQHLILTSLIGLMAPVKPRWCKLQRSSSVSGVVLLVIEGISAVDYANMKSFKDMQTTFDTVVEVVPLHQSNYNPIAELLWVPVTNLRHREILKGKRVSTLETVNTEKSQSPLNEEIDPVSSFSVASVSNISDVFPRTKLLLSSEQMLLENYPLPGTKSMVGYVFSKDQYAKVSPHSPLFGIDCEMCITSSGESELTRISIVNEKLEVVYDTLVKPWNKIVDYLTVYSGITKEILSDITTRLKDVQKHLQLILPPDAILCGHSLNFDLHAMKMIHPYVIDTSFIYNLQGRNKKDSLKYLVKTLLNENIQVGSRGHDSTEDSLSALKLVQLKLSKSIDFGDVASQLFKWDNVKARHDIFSHEDGFVSSLIGHITFHEKKVAIVSCSDLTGQQMPPELNSETDSTTALFNLASNKDVFKKSKHLAANNDLTIAHMKVDTSLDTLESNETSFVKLKKYINKVHDSLAANALYIVLFGGSSEIHSESNCNVGVCMIKLK